MTADRRDLGRSLGRGKEAEVFAFGPGVLKLYRAEAGKAPAFLEAAHLAMVETLAVPAPRVLGVQAIGRQWGLAMTLAPGEAFGAALEREPALVPDYLAAMARLHASIHRCPGTRLGGFKERLRRDLGQAGLGEERRHSLLSRLAALPEGDRLCHGDFHPWNVLGTPGEPVVVDWLDARSGAPAADACRSFLLMALGAPSLAADYLACYRVSTGLPERDIMAWLPVLAGARLAEGVAGEAPRLHAMIGGSA